MLAEIQNLREISRCCQAGEPIDGEIASWFGGCLEAFLERRCTTIEEALGLIFPKGGVPWWRDEAIRQRDAALRQLAEMLLPDQTPGARARIVHEQSRRYAASSWRFDRDRDAMPETYAGTAKAWLWRAFASGATMPIGERQLRTIFGR